MKLFGSRARGDHHRTSDVDLAFDGEEGAGWRLAAALEDSRLPFTFDVVDYGRSSSPELRKAIDEEGVFLWRKAKEGAEILTESEIRMKWEQFHKAVSRLRIALSKEPDEDEIYLDATIQRFEFCFELAWKLMKTVMEYDGILARSPRSTIREAWKQGLIPDAEAWLDMLENRNLSSYTYDEENALAIYWKIQEKYIAMLTALDGKIETRLH